MEAYLHRSFAAVAITLCGVFAAAQVKADNLVVNPGFETGDLAGWILSGTDASPEDDGIYYGVDAIDAHSGSYGAFWGPVGGILNLNQALSTTPGTSYAVSFWLAQAPATPLPYVNSFAVAFGETILVSETAVPVSSYAENSYAGVADSSSTSLLFAFRNDTGFFSLDDISVTSNSVASSNPVPEPTSLLFVASALGAFFLSGVTMARRVPDAQRRHSS